MNNFHFPEPFKHLHPRVRDLNEIVDEQLTFAERCADRVAAMAGSWRFIVVQTVLFLAWVVVNVLTLFKHWDPYPFILMNLVLSVEAAYSGPVIMMSQNRQASKDRLEAHNDFLINQKAEEEIKAVLNHLSAQQEALKLMHQGILSLLSSVGTGNDALTQDSRRHLAHRHEVAEVTCLEIKQVSAKNTD